MSRKLELEQNYRDNYSLIFILGFLFLTIVKTSQLIASGSQISLEFIALLAIIIILGSVVYLLTISNLKVKFGKKKISIKIQPLGFTKIKFEKSKIENIDFVHASPMGKSSGMLIHFGSKRRIFDFGGNKAMIISLRDGRKFSFFSKTLYDQKNKILAAVFQ